MQTDLRIVATLDPATGVITEELLLLVDIFDPDGIEDVGEIRLAHDGEKVVWRASADTLPRRFRDGQEWFVLSAGPVSGAKTVPRGTYRLEVDDLSQRGAVRQVTVPLNVPRTEGDDLPSIDDREIVVPAGAEAVIVVHVQRDSEIQYYQVSGASSGVGRIPASALPPPVRQVVFSGNPVPDAEGTGDTGRVWLVHEVNANLIRRSGPWR